MTRVTEKQMLWPYCINVVILQKAWTRPDCMILVLVIAKSEPGCMIWWLNNSKIYKSSDCVNSSWLRPDCINVVIV